MQKELSKEDLGVLLQLGVEEAAIFEEIGRVRLAATQRERELQTVIEKLQHERTVAVSSMARRYLEGEAGDWIFDSTKMAFVLKAESKE